METDEKPNKTSNFEKIKPWHWILGLGLIPIFIWLLMIIPTIPVNNLINETHWLGFFGGYIGACITGGITLYVLRITSISNTKNLESTLSQNQRNHQESVELQNAINTENKNLNTVNREHNEHLNLRQQQLQINTTLYAHHQDNVKILRGVLEDNYRVIDYQKLTLVLNYMRLGSVDYANQLLMDINRDVEICGVKLDLYLKPDVTNEIEKNYKDTFNSIFINYGMLVNDFIIINSIVSFIQKSQPQVDEFHKYIKLICDSVQPQNYFGNDIRRIYESENSIYKDLLKLTSKTTIDEILLEINNITSDRINSITSNHSEKQTLINVTIELLSYNEEQAKKILTDKLE